MSNLLALCASSESDGPLKQDGQLNLTRDTSSRHSFLSFLGILPLDAVFSSFNFLKIFVHVIDTLKIPVQSSEIRDTLKNVICPLHQFKPGDSELQDSC